MKSPGVRLSGGAHRGRILKVPPQARPTESRVREALFSIWGPGIDDCRFLDLFAGSGAVGLEAAGRGAFEVLAVDANPRAIRVLEANRQLLKEDALTFRRLQLPEDLPILADQEAPFDFVFADPPYRFTDHAVLLDAVAPLLAPDGEFALEHDRRNRPPLEAGGLVRTAERRYGESALSFFRLQSP